MGAAEPHATQKNYLKEMFISGKRVLQDDDDDDDDADAAAAAADDDDYYYYYDCGKYITFVLARDNLTEHEHHDANLQLEMQLTIVLR